MLVRWAMVDSYMGAAYRGDRAREQGRAFSAPGGAAGFLKPGFPVDAPLKPPVEPPPPLVPVLGGGGAAASGATLGVVGVVVAVGGAYVLSRQIKRDIERFKRDARLPFYDDLAVMSDQDWAQAKPGFDAQADADYAAHIDSLVRGYMRTHQGEYEDWLYHVGKWWRFMRYGGACAGQVFGPHGNGRFTAFYGYLARNAWRPNCSISHVNWEAEWNSAGLAESPYVVFTTGDPIDPAHGTGIGSKPNPGVNDAYAEFWADPDTAVDLGGGLTQYETTVGNVWRSRVDTNVQPAEGLYYGHGRSVNPWRDGVAPPGSQPSLEQQNARERLPSGSPREGYYVLPPLNYPLTQVNVEPGSPPVTVPGVVIEPGVGTTLIPPGANDWGNPDEYRERKPRHRFSGAMMVNVFTETEDFFEALHKGLPKKYRSKYRKGIVPNGDIVLRDIWDNWDHFDADVALEAIINNQIEDHILGKYYFGKVSRFQRKYAGRHLARTVGLAGGAKYVPVPQIHFTNGRHEITVGDVVISTDDLERITG